MHYQATGRGEIHPRFPGEGVLMRHSSRPTNQCKGRSEPITENSSNAPPCFGPLAPDDRARRLAELRTALAPDDRARRLAELRTALAGAAPTFQARLRAGERGERP